MNAHSTERVMEQSVSMSSFKSVLRQSGSSNCLRRMNCNGQNNMSANQKSPKRNDNATQTVTVINSHQLPNYSTERYYMLSEIEIKGHSISFLDEWMNDDDDQSVSTHPTSSCSTSSIEEDNLSREDNKKSDNPLEPNNDNNDEKQGEQQQRNVDRILDVREQPDLLTTASQQQQPVQAAVEESPDQLPPAIILYLLWPSSCTQYTTPQAFAEGPVYDAVQAILQKIQNQQHDNHITTELSPSHMNIDVTTNNYSPPVSPTRTDTSPSTPANPNTLASSLLGPSTKKKHRIYVVIDRLTNTATQKHENSVCEAEIAIAESLVKIIATSKRMQLRSIIEGVSVGLSSDTRAAPGLDACLTAINLGETERRTFFKKRLSFFRRKDENLFSLIGRKLLGIGSAVTNTNSTESCIHSSTDNTKHRTYNTSDSSCADPNRSSIGIVTLNSDQLVGLDASRETDAVQGLSIHHLSCAEWYGQGDIRSFAARAQRMWRRKWVLSQYEGDIMNDSDFDDVDSMAHYHETSSSATTNATSRRKKKQVQQHNQKQQYKDDQQISNQADFYSDMMVLAFLLVVGTHIWTLYGEDLKSLALKLLVP